PQFHAGKEACFVRFPSITNPPDQGVATDSAVIVRFSEPMDPTRLAPFDTLTITRTSGTPVPSDFVVGGITASSDVKEFRFTPVLPFKHVTGSTETYFLNLASGANGRWTWRAIRWRWRCRSWRSGSGPPSRPRTMAAWPCASARPTRS